MPPTHLDKILEATTARVNERKAAAHSGRMETQAADHIPRGFAAALRAIAVENPAIIAELKKASPSVGVIAKDYRPRQIARVYAAAGAAAISVLTEEDFFQGSLEHLRAVSTMVSIPVLRKDFIVDPFQIVEARANSADAVLLIAAVLNDDMLTKLAAEARRWELDVVCEVHNREELDRALQLGFDIIGVNSRDLKTLKVRLETHMELIQLLPPTILRIAESGITRPEDVVRLRNAGYDAMLIGEVLMRHYDPAALITSLLGQIA